MRKQIWIFSIFLMLSCIGVGLSLPNMVYFKSMDKTIGQIEEYSIEPVEIGKTNSILDAMRCVSYGNYTSDYQEDLATLSREQVFEVCNSFLGELEANEWGYYCMEVDESNSEMYCELCVAGDGENGTISAVLWTVRVELYEGEYAELKVDDRNQKVVQMLSFEKANSAYTNSVSVYYYGENENQEYLREVLIPFLKKYYDVGIGDILMEPDHMILDIIDSYNEMIRLSIDFDFTNRLLNLSVLG